MMKMRSLLLVVLAFVLYACGPSGSGEGEPAVQEEAPVQVDVGSTATPEIQAVDLAGLDAGTTMNWYDGNDLVFVPAGTFIMGGQDDIPQREVSLNSYWIYKYPVTNGMYLKCIEAGACDPPASEPPYPADLLDPQIQDYPVVGVNWEQAESYCGWMDARLPSETEWEKAARGTTGNQYPWGGGQPGCDLANFKDCVGSTSHVTGTPGGASPYGVVDMAGNTFEWVHDWYGEDIPAAGDQDPQGPETGDQRVVRSSSFESSADELPAARRFSLQPGKYRDDLGFRCVVKDPQGFAPFCEVNSYYVPLSDGNGGTPSCEPSLPSVDVTPYCVNRDAGLGGANVRTVEGFGGFFGFETSGGHCEYDPGGGDMVVCWGPENATLTLSVGTSCDPGLENFANTCEDGYTLTEGVCEFSGFSGSPGASCPSGFLSLDGDTCMRPGPSTENCPLGFDFDASRGCCGEAYADAQEPLVSYPLVCPPGFEEYPPGSNWCMEILPAVETTFTVTLGDCLDLDGGGDDGGCNLTPKQCGPNGVNQATCTCN